MHATGGREALLIPPRVRRNADGRSSRGISRPLLGLGVKIARNNAHKTCGSATTDVVVLRRLRAALRFTPSDGTSIRSSPEIHRPRILAELRPLRRHPRMFGRRICKATARSPQVAGACMLRYEPEASEEYTQRTVYETRTARAIITLLSVYKIATRDELSMRDYIRETCNVTRLESARRITIFFAFSTR